MQLLYSRVYKKWFIVVTVSCEILMLITDSFPSPSPSPLIGFLVFVH